jgi:hypothetical protein
MAGSEAGRRRKNLRRGFSGKKLAGELERHLVTLAVHLEDAHAVAAHSV